MGKTQTVIIEDEKLDTVMNSMYIYTYIHAYIFFAHFCHGGEKETVIIEGETLDTVMELRGVVGAF